MLEADEVGERMPIHEDAKNFQRAVSICETYDDCIYNFQFLMDHYIRYHSKYSINLSSTRRKKIVKSLRWMKKYIQYIESEQKELPVIEIVGASPIGLVNTSMSLPELPATVGSNTNTNFTNITNISNTIMPDFGGGSMLVKSRSTSVNDCKSDIDSSGSNYVDLAQNLMQSNSDLMSNLPSVPSNPLPLPSIPMKSIQSAASVPSVPTTTIPRIPSATIPTVPTIPDGNRSSMQDTATCTERMNNLPDLRMYNAFQSACFFCL